MERLADQLLVPNIKLHYLYDDKGEINIGKNRIKVDSFYLDIYPVTNGLPEKIKRIDIKKIVTDSNPDSLPISLYNVYLVGERKVVEIGVYNPKNGNHFEDVSIDIETEQLCACPEIEQSESNSEKALIQKTNFSDLINEYGLDYSSYDNWLYISPWREEENKNEDKERVPRNDNWEQLLIIKQNPELLEFFDVDEESRSKLFLSEKLTGEQLVTWFYPEDKDMFKKLVLNESNSIDNDNHKITSMEEFNKYYKYSPENYKKPTTEE